MRNGKARTAARAAGHRIDRHALGSYYAAVEVARLGSMVGRCYGGQTLLLGLGRSPWIAGFGLDQQGAAWSNRPGDVWGVGFDPALCSNRT